MGLLHAIRFLTILPLPGGGEADEGALGRATGWYPVVGLVIGALLAGAELAALLVWPSGVAAGLTVVGWIVLTRGFHLDGLADTADGLGGGVDRARRLEIMKDSRIGTFGVLALIAVLGLKVVLLVSLSALGTGRAAALGSSPGGGATFVAGAFRDRWAHGLLWKALLAAPVLGRWVMLAALFLFPTARAEGLGALVKRNCRRPQFMAGTVVALAVTVVLLGWWGLVTAAGVMAVGLLAAAFFSRALGGLVGDSYGALCEIAEVVTLLLISAGGAVGRTRWF